MEIVVATTIFAFVAVAMMALFNYTLKINRRADALRQATQGMRNLTEFLVKEVRNGKIDYSVSSGKVVASPSGWRCPLPSVPVGQDNRNDGGNIYGQGNPTLGADNALGIVTTEGDRECIYLVQVDQSGVESYDPAQFTGQKLKLNKNGRVEDLTPPNVFIEYAMFAVRPLKDPYTTLPAGSSPKVQPLVTINLKFSAHLPTGEVVPIYYQTTVSSDKYDVPTQ